MTRVVQDVQLTFGQTPINEIRFDPRSRDDIPQILQGLQYLYVTPCLQKALFQTLHDMIPPDVNPDSGRRGMALWKIFVLGTLRVNLNWDYDRLHEMANTHTKIRQMLGHGLWDDAEQYCLQTLKDNLRLLTPTLLDKINKIVVEAGHSVVKKKEEKITLHGRCDSFVVETPVHYPTDINLLFDAMRHVITLSAQLSTDSGETDWRQHDYQRRTLKRAFRLAQKTKRVHYKNTARQAAHETRVIAAYMDYLSLSQALLLKSEKTLKPLAEKGLMTSVAWRQLQQFRQDAYRQIDQINRRVLKHEVIPHAEKVFSLYERYTEWVQKGKAKAPVELGLRVCVLEDQFGFLLHHRVLVHQTDSDVTVSMVKQTQQRFANLRSCSFDKGFYSPAHRSALNALLDHVVLPKKGRLTQAEQVIVNEVNYQKRRRQHAAIESAINALEVHGLDRCLDRGIDGFERYIGLAIVARNIQQLGALLRSRHRLKLCRKKIAA